MLKLSSLLLLLTLASCAGTESKNCDCRAKKVANTKAELEKKADEAGCTLE